MGLATALLSNVIDSFEKLEIVVALHARAHDPVQTSELAHIVGLPFAATHQALSALARHRVVRSTKDVGWHIDDATPWRTNIDALVELNQTDRIELMKLITNLAIQRVRHQAATVFADAFLLRPPKRNGTE